MNIPLNLEQSKGLANFFFDIAKGLVLGGIGFATVAPFEQKIIVSISSFILAFWSVKTALALLEKKS
ncbi:hypothetical protein HYW54_04595 [Candidatus Gottesmanbacteria bacterium]|nr:hypothetical protein [Candidatus Gottesmanbacteria bacterium]